MIWKAVLVLSAAALALPVLSWGQELEDEDYVKQFFGTTLLLTSEQPLGDETIYWTELLPEDLLYGSGFIAGVVNSHRISIDDPNLINSSDEVVLTNWEELPVDEGFQYSIDFIGLRPSEVELVLGALGGLAEFLPGVSTSYEPLRRRGFSLYAESIGASLELKVGSDSYELDSNLPFNAIREEVEEIMRQQFGDVYVDDISLSYSIFDGYESVSLYFEAEFPAG